ncbi:LLM class flavin-dependent oxidoreductase [Kineosporia sp. R_H_3]|uniref:LLM class flavin-dependent oxidoreductase n=1 Tax=Kineosporia sp. R_H_3 TaxID=1961848 RepID=UPI000B4BF171|nr:LLM class flavin-dependent oxidoreductase [Kineosporia sp. R_H_3]
MRIGLIILPQRPWSEQADQWRRAEADGYDHLWTYDHLTWDPLEGTPWGATVPTLVAAATVTTRVPLGTWVASPNYRHPVPFARELAGLDDVSGGRAVLGVGAGGTGHDARVLGGPELTPGERAARFEEFVDVLDMVLTGAATTHDGPAYRAVDARTTVACVQRPRLPFVIAANGPRTVRLAVRRGEGWATTGTLRRSEAGTDDAWWDGVARLSDQVDEALAADGRDPATLRRYLSVDAAPTFALVSAGYLEEVVGRAAALGFTDVVAHWPLPGAPVYDAPESVLDDVAALLPALQAVEPAAR